MPYIRHSKRRSMDPSDMFAEHYRGDATFEFSAGTTAKVSYRDTVLGERVVL